MKRNLLTKTITLTLFLSILIGSFYDAFTYNTSVPVSRTTADASNCGGCHGTGSTSKNITLTGIPSTGWLNDSTYTMKISVKASQKAGGFQVVCLDKTKKGSYGTVSVGSGKDTKKQTNSTAKRDYIAHSKKLAVSSGSLSWEFDWKAPSKGSDTITFYIIVNDANNDGSDGGDKIVFATFTFNPDLGSGGSAPSASFKASSTKVCQNDSITITDLSTGSPTKWDYYSTLLKKSYTAQNPTIKYVGAFGTDTVSLIATNSNGSSSKFTQVINVNVAPSDVITDKLGNAVTSASLCSGDTLFLTAPAGSAWKWSDGQTSQIGRFLKASTFSVVTTNSSGCSSTASITISSGSAPTAPKINFLMDSVCDGATAVVNIPTGVKYSTSYLFESGKLISTQSAGNISFTPKASGKYSVIIEEGCKSTSSNTIDLTLVKLSTPTLSTSLGKEFCEGDNLSFIGNYDTKTNSVELLNGSTSLYSGKPIKLLNFGKADIKNTDSFLLVSRITNLGCSATSKGLMPKVNPAPVVSFTSTQVGTKVTFKNATTGAKSYLWAFGNNKADTAKNPIHTYAKIGTYKVKLTALSPKNCIAIDSTTLIVTGIEESKSSLDLGFKISPNPANYKLNISSNGNIAQSIKVYNLSGRLEMEIQNPNVNEIILDKLNSGTYYLLISTSKGNQVIPFLKN